MEKVYQTMKNAGIFNVAVGISLIAFGVVTGVFSIVNGARLLRRKNKVLF